jgi:segregation and condensation protein A
MKTLKNENFALENFEGPLDFLMHLIQKNEIDIYDIPLHQIIEQFKSKLNNECDALNSGADFVGTTSALIWMKSKMLLPKHEQVTNPEEEEIDPSFEIIHQLLDYCKFKQAAKELSDREQKQNAFYSRGLETFPELKKRMGIDHIALEDLAALFKKVLDKAAENKEPIFEEAWRVCDKLKELRHYLLKYPTIRFNELFTSKKSKVELIVTFLAILELLKLEEAKVIHDLEVNEVIIVAPSYHR